MKDQCECQPCTCGPTCQCGTAAADFSCGADCKCIDRDCAKEGASR